MNTAIFRLRKRNPGADTPLRLASLAMTPSAINPVPAFPRRKILIVDDDQVILKSVSLRLQSSGYAVATAADASAAIAALRDERPDLVILDLNFPPDIASGGFVTWDGFQIMSWLRGLGEAGHVPFIILTGEDPARCEQKCISNGAIACFQKPVDHQALLGVIKRALANRGGPSQPTPDGEVGP